MSKKVCVPVWLVVHKENIVYDFFTVKQQAKDLVMEKFKENKYQDLRVVRGEIRFNKQYRS